MLTQRLRSWSFPRFNREGTTIIMVIRNPDLYACPNRIYGMEKEKLLKDPEFSCVRNWKAEPGHPTLKGVV
jgi:hypothetical protein